MNTKFKTSENDIDGIQGVKTSLLKLVRMASISGLWGNLFHCSVVW